MVVAAVLLFGDGIGTEHIKINTPHLVCVHYIIPIIFVWIYHVIHLKRIIAVSIAAQVHMSLDVISAECFRSVTFETHYYEQSRQWLTSFVVCPPPLLLTAVLGLATLGSIANTS